MSSFAPVLDRVELDAPLRRRQHRGQIAHARHRLGLAGARRAPDRRGGERLDVPDRVADADAAPMVDVRRAAELGRERGDDLLHERRDADRDVAGRGTSLLVHDHDLVAQLLGVVRAHLRPEPVLQRRHDAAAVRVVVGVRGRDQQQVERQADPVAADLDVALLQDVEQRYLDALGEVGELVDRHDAAVRARDHAVVDRQLVGEVAALGHTDRVDVADQVGDRRVGRGQLLRVPILARDPMDRYGVAVLRDQRDAPRADRSERVIVDLAAVDHGDRRRQVG